MAGGRPFQPGHPRFGGRKPGTKNKIIEARESALLRSGLSPLDFLITTFRNEAEPTSVRVDAARTVCQFIYPRLSSLDFECPQRSTDDRAGDQVC